MLKLVGGPAGMAIALAVLAAPAGATSHARAQGGGTLAGAPQEGGTQYGAPVVRANPARPVARYFRVGPRVVVAPNLPKIALRGTKPPLQPGFGQQVEGVGRFAEEQYANQCEQVKSALERALRPPRSLRQSPDLAEILGKQRRYQARLAELDQPQDNRPSLFSSHNLIVAG